MTIRIEDLHNTDFSDVVVPRGKRIPPTCPGDILRHDYLEPLGLSANALAMTLHVPANRITGILRGQRAITADTALRLGRYFGTTAQFWLNLQSSYDLAVAEKETGKDIARSILPIAM